MPTAARWVSALTTQRKQFVERIIIPASDVQRAVLAVRLIRLFADITQSCWFNFITAIYPTPIGNIREGYTDSTLYINSLKFNRCHQLHLHK